MYETGRVCLKTAGRDSNLPCVIIEVVDEKTVLIDGATRRRKVNVNHIEPTTKILEVAKSAATDVVVKALEDAGFTVPKKGAARKTPERPKKQKVVKAKAKPVEVKKAPAKKKVAKKAEPAKVEEKPKEKVEETKKA